MKRLLTIIATLALSTNVWGQAPIVPIDAYGAGPGVPTPAVSADGGLAPIVDQSASGALSAAEPSGLPYGPTPMPGGSAYSSCGCVGRCQGECQGDGVVGCLTGCRQCPPNCACPLCLPQRMWFSGNYVQTFTKSRSLPPLVTTSPDGTARALAGRLPGATILYGAGSSGNSTEPGMQLDFGRWLGDGHVGFGGRLFYMQREGDGFSLASNGTSPIIGLPYIDLGAVNDAILLSHPEVGTNGSVDISNDLETISGEALFRFKIADSCGIRFSLLGGYHYIRVDDNVLLRAQTTDIDNTNLITNGTVIDITDAFNAENQFHGGSFGLSLRLRQNRTVVHGMAKMSIGNMHQQLNIAGQQTFTDPNPAIAPVTINNGLYAQASMIGQQARDKTTFIPEASLQLGHRLSDRVDVNIGYMVLYMTNVAQAGDSINQVVDIFGAGGPAAQMKDGSLWIQGITAGIGYNW
ncbi:MAG: BBP7 family outer membrane beta-barrel protein [Planctomycetales bacterium]|nr:BBP7 family outer membrane beta-barrel protein [Planctomycetales bacterium]